MMSKATQIYDKMMAQDHCSQWLGVGLINIEEGRCILEMQVRKEMLNGYGILHGGIAFTFADSAFAFASNSYGRQALSITGRMDYSRSAKEGQWLIAEARPKSISYKIATFDVVVMDKLTKEPYYHFRGTVYRSSKEILDT